MRKKTKQSVDVANVADAWQAFFDGNKIEDDAELKKNGWLDVYTISKKINLSACTISKCHERLGLISEKFRVYRGGKIREVRYCRPK